MPWDPWAAAAERSDLVVVLDPVAALLGGGFRVRRGDRTYIVLDPRAEARHLRAVLAHELVHDERGASDRPGSPATWDAVVAREEAAVDREVARRLAPAAAVRRAVEELRAGGLPVTVEAVADHLDVDPTVAARALDDLRARRRRRRR